MSKTLLVIPHYRDTARLAPFLGELCRTLPPHFSILISDDGSGEDELVRLRALVSSMRGKAAPGRAAVLDPHLCPHNTGKGGAVMRGWAQGAGYSLLAFVDADGAVSAKEILRAERHMRSESGRSDALFGSRVKMLGRSITRTPLRHVIGRVFATLVSTVAGLNAYDTQCGVKILSQEAFRRIQMHMKSVGFAFDVELCLLLLKNHCSIQEFPIDWTDIDGSKVRLLRDSVSMAIEVFKIRRRVSSISF